MNEQLDLTYPAFDWGLHDQAAIGTWVGHGSGKTWFMGSILKKLQDQQGLHILNADLAQLEAQFLYGTSHAKDFLTTWDSLGFFKASPALTTPSIKPKPAHAKGHHKYSPIKPKVEPAGKAKRWFTTFGHPPPDTMWGKLKLHHWEVMGNEAYAVYGSENGPRRFSCSASTLLELAAEGHLLEYTP